MNAIFSAQRAEVAVDALVRARREKKKEIEGQRGVPQTGWLCTGLFPLVVQPCAHCTFFCVECWVNL
jgi:hypothetical protein